MVSMAVDAASATKVLVCGDVRGHLDACFARVTTVNANHGPFACLLCVGDFLGPLAGAPELLAPFRSGERTPPLPTYFLGPPGGGLPSELLASSDAGGEVAPRMTCLGAAGIHVLSGLKVAFISGAQTDAEQLPTDGVAELKRLSGMPGYAGVDIFLSNQWPRGFFRQLPDGALPADLLPDSDLPAVGAEAVAELVTAIRPRYHFCGDEGQFWQRPAYRQPGEGSTHVCRMLGLAAVQADSKGRKKWLHAASLVPMSQMAPAVLSQAPADTTDCPYPYARLGPLKRAGGGAGGGQPKAKRPRPEFAKDTREWVADSCWFCMSSPKFESHLVSSIGEETYVAMAKGPLTDHHALVLPIVHKRCLLELSESEEKEVSAYLEAMRRCCEARGQQLVVFERYMGRSQFEHMHLQAVPLPAHLAAGAREHFERHGAKLGVKFEVLPPGTSLDEAMETVEPFFRVELPSGEQLLHRLATNERRHPLQFGREVIANILGTPQLADWKLCLPKTTPARPGTVEELEAQATEDFKNAFAAFDPAK